MHRYQPILIRSDKTSAKKFTQYEHDNASRKRNPSMDDTNFDSLNNKN